MSVESALDKLTCAIETPQCADFLATIAPMLEHFLNAAYQQGFHEGKLESQNPQRRIGMSVERLEYLSKTFAGESDGNLFIPHEDYAQLLRNAAAVIRAAERFRYAQDGGGFHRAHRYLQLALAKFNGESQ